jgi:uncharacterized damage-inducible protein DinB
MRPTDIAELFDHLYWMRDRILRAADAPGVPLTTEAHATIRDLRATLVHELDVEWSWRERLAGPDPTEFLADDERAMRAWLATLDEAALERPCPAERDAKHPFWVHLQHLYTHSIQQFSDAAVALTLAGRSPGELDFLDFVLERERGS